MSAIPYTTVSIDAAIRPPLDRRAIAHKDGTITIYLVDQPGYIVYLNGTYDELRQWRNDVARILSEPVEVGV